MKKLVAICCIFGITFSLQSCVSTGGGILPSSLSTNTSTIQKPKPFAGKRVALVIGNNGYAPQVGALNNPINDATDIASALKNLGFDVTLKTNATKQMMNTAIKEFGQKSKGADVSLVYYSGHGMQANGENILLPIDYNPNTEETISANTVQKTMQDATDGTKILILDACRTDPDKDVEEEAKQSGTKNLKGKTKAAKNSSSTKTGLAQMTAHRQFVIMFATAAGVEALDGKTGERNSPYVIALLKHIKEPIPIEMLTTRVAATVAQATTPPIPPLKEPQSPALYLGGLTKSFCFTDCGTNLASNPVANTCNLQIGQGSYEGECQDGKANGQGIQRYATGEYYSGSFQNNLRNGYGTQYLKSGGELAGNWQNGRFIGK